jgi:hypothetical protein
MAPDEERSMPELCRFLGISITMYFNDHDPPHFHVRYNEHRGKFGIADLAMMDGDIPSIVTALVLEWANVHRMELAANWKSLKEDGSFKRIEPLI